MKINHVRDQLEQLVLAALQLIRQSDVSCQNYRASHLRSFDF